MTTLFFDNRRLLVLLVALILVGGLSALVTMPLEEDPKITNRGAVILTPFPGASAERVEQLVTEKLENELREIVEIDEIRSSSRAGLSSVSVVLDETIYETDGPFSIIRDAITDAEKSFPNGAGTPIFDDDRGYAYTVMAALVWDAENEPNTLILKRIAEELQDRLRDVPGTELVTIFGAPDEEVVVAVDNAVSESLGLDKTAIAATIAQADSKVAAGQFYGRENEYTLEVRGELTSLSRLRDVPLREDSEGAIVRVGDIGSVKRTLVEPINTVTLARGEIAVVVATRMETGLRVDAWAATVRGALGEFETELSDGVRLDVIFDQSAYASERFGILIQNLIVGVALVVAVLIVTLGWRSALIVTTAIPLTTLSAILFLNILGIPIHQMSITGLVVALGLLVDAAIVMADAIRRKILAGMDARDAVSQSVRRLWVPLLSSTVTTVLAFMPITLLPGGAGEFVGPIAISVILSLTASYLLAVSAGAALSGIFLGRFAGKYAAHGEPGGKKAPFWVTGISIPGLGWLFGKAIAASLRAPRISIIGAMTLPIIGFLGVGTLPSQFFPQADRNQFHIELRLSPQATLTQTRAFVERASDILSTDDRIDTVDWFIGNSVPSFYYNLQQNQDGVSSYAEAMVTAKKLSGLTKTIDDLQVELSAALPEAQVIVRQLLQGPPSYAPVELRLYGKDLKTLQALGEEARAIMADVPEIITTYASIGGGQPKLWLNADEDAARQVGLSLVDVARSLDAQLQGVSGGSVVEGAEELPIKVRLDDETRAQFDELESLTVLGSGQPSVRGDFDGTPITALGDITLEPAPDVITHYQAQRVNIVSGFMRAGELPATAVEHFEALAEERGYEMPPGYRYEFGGDNEARSDAVGNLLSSVGLIVTMIVATVVLTFNSFRLSAVVFVVAFLSIGLGMLSLTIFGFPFGFNPIIGLLGLVGVAINAAIIIISTLRLDPKAIAGDLDAIKDGVMETARHITSTTITTFGGFLPLILSDGGFWPPFATAIAGGVLLSTVVSFFFVPQAFLLVTRGRPVSLDPSLNQDERAALSLQLASS
ncbi:MAG: efflux RND transporter permease subunit [Pseudomonadota bacterium]